MKFEEFLSVVSKVANVEGITEDTKISAVLNSFEFVKVVVLLEDQLDIELEDDDLVYNDSKTFGEFVKCIEGIE